MANSSRELAKALLAYTDKRSKHYDAAFVKRIKEIAPLKRIRSWYEDMAISVEYSEPGIVKTIIVEAEAGYLERLDVPDHLGEIVNYLFEIMAARGE